MSTKIYDHWVPLTLPIQRQALWYHLERLVLENDTVVIVCCCPQGNVTSDRRCSHIPFVEEYYGTEHLPSTNKCMPGLSSPSETDALDYQMV